jgi:hypothetical protein
MTAKKNFSSFGFATKFGSIAPVLQSICKYSALECVLLTCLCLVADILFENFAGVGVCVSHQNLLIGLSGTFLNSSSGWLLSSKDV